MKVAESLIAAFFIGLNLVASIPPFVGIIIYATTSRLNPRVTTDYRRKNILIAFVVSVLLVVNMALGIAILAHSLKDQQLILLTALISIFVNALTFWTVQSYKFIKTTIKVIIILMVVLFIFELILFK